MKTDSHERQECKTCKHPMQYSFPSPNSDPAVEAQLGRFQICRNQYCKGSLITTDIETGNTYSVRWDRTIERLIVDDEQFKDVAEWVRSLGIV